MRLYHSTSEKNITNILKKGLLPNRIGIVYLSPAPQKNYGGIVLEVETGDNKL